MADTPLEQELIWLYSTQTFGIKLGLEGITRLLKTCGVYYPKARVIHVAGTNGKGSTCAFAESVARAAGYRTGLFTSPHLVEFGERIRVNGQNIPAEDAARLIALVRTTISGWETPPTFFEIVLVVAMLYFAEQQVDIIILETGMGGRLDATNAVPKDVAVITPIDIDHTQYLGNSLFEIASEKAAIIAWHRPVVVAPQLPDALRAIHDAAQQMDTDYRIVTEECELPLGLRGSYQRRNAALAVAALRLLPHFLCSEAELAKGLAEVYWPGRFEEVAPGVIMDGAHNPQAIRVLVQTWQAQFPGQKARCIYAGSADKALDEVITLLAPIVSEWVLPPVNSPRILPPPEMAAKIREICPETPLSLPATLAEPLNFSVYPVPTLICGSFFLLGEAKALAQAAAYHPTAQ
ncbi:MAG: bifunctional folylpolyglutamate synthase/dihydrofolate synthase [Akkermansia sp.]|nr:bifunctional folylpolyglutamate synthase/dihydrofolate synthase [Akkermansia sp.]